MDLMPAQVHVVLEVNPKVASDKIVTFLVIAWGLSVYRDDMA
jgi:hypothetical protein